MEEEDELIPYEFSFTFTQTITGFASARSEEVLKDGLLETYGHLPDYKLESITFVSDEETLTALN